MSDFDVVRKALSDPYWLSDPEDGLAALARIQAENERLVQGVDNHLYAIKALEREVERLREEVERLKHLHTLDHSLADQWQAENERLRDALRYYGKESNYSAGYVRRDRGKRARAALKEQP